MSAQIWYGPTRHREGIQMRPSSSVEDRQGFSRRGFLHGSALVAGSAILSACSSSGSGGSSSSGSSASAGTAGKGKGSAKKPLAPPKKFAESPLLASQVKSGKLPAVGKRLPER